MTFTIDDMEQMALFQAIYILLLYVLTLREIKRKPRTSLLWLMLTVDVLYVLMLGCLIYIVTAGIAKNYNPHFRWDVLLLSIFVPGLLILIAFAVYNVQKEMRFKSNEIKQ